MTKKNGMTPTTQKIKGLVDDLGSPDRRIILRTKNKGSWMRLLGTTVTVTLLAATEIFDLLCAHYDVTPANLKKCDVLSKPFSARHRLS